MEIDLALLADGANIDRSGKLNILGIFDRIAVREFPARHGRISLVLRFALGLQEAGGHEVNITLRSPQGEELMRLTGSAQLGGSSPVTGALGSLKVPHVLNLDGVVFTEPGLHHFDVSVDGEHQVSIPLSLQASGSGPSTPLGRPAAEA